VIATRWYWVGLIGCSTLLAIAYFYFQEQLGLPPCPLCMFQRACLVGVAFFCLLGIVFRPKKVGSRLLALGAVVFSGLGLAIAGRQVWLQHLPKDQVPECGPDLEFMLNSFPLAETIQTVLSGSGECAEVLWRFIGLSMPEWMVFVFSVMVIISLRLLFTKERNYFSGALGR
jgi:disulfide bond formation protein DsbB